MELPPLTQHHLRRLLADGRWQRLRFHLAWSTTLYCFILLWLFSKIPALSSHSFFTFMLIVWPVVIVSICMVLALIDELPRARRDNMLELLSLAGIDPVGVWLRQAALTLVLALNCLLCLLPLFLLFAAQGYIRLTTLVMHGALVLLMLLYLLSATLLATIRSAESGRSLLNLTAILSFSSLLVPQWAVSLDGLLPAPWLGKDWHLLGPLNIYLRSFGDFKDLHRQFPMIVGGMLFWITLFHFLAHRFCDFRQPVCRPVVPSRRVGFLPRLLAGLTGSVSSAPASNPLAPLMRRERMIVLYAWITTFGILGLMLFLLCSRGVAWFTPFDLILAGIAVSSVLLIFTRAVGERIMADARREGLLELILTTGLTPKEFVDGIAYGTTRHFRRLFWFTVAVLGTFAMLGAHIRPLNTQAIISYCLVWAWIFFICWESCFRRNPRSIWLALNLGRPAHSVAKLWLPAFFAIIVHGTTMLYSPKGSAYQAFAGFPSGNAFELTVTIFCSIICLILNGASLDDFTEETLLTHFREIATHPLPDPGDERIAKWDRSKVFPTPKDT